MCADRKFQIVFALVLVVNIALWFSVRFVQASWVNVPPAPDVKYASLAGLGDRSFAYRLNALMIQNFGDTGGRLTPLEDYNFNILADWFFLQDHLDEQSDFMPYLAAYYFGGVQKPEKFRPLLDYLQMVGVRPYGEKWRWLAQGVFLARFRLNDLDRALELAELMSSSGASDVPAWARQMPAFIMNVQGEKKAAYALMLEILKTSAETLHPNEVYSMRIFMCTRLLEEEEAAKNSLCDGL